MGSLAGDNKQQYIPSGFYKGSKVAIKRINEKNINLSRDQMLELKKVNRLNFHHLFANNINTNRTGIFESIKSLFSDERYSSRTFG